MDTYKREETQTEVKDDPRARALMREAFESTARWQADFKGFTADLTVNVNGKETKGSVTVKGRVRSPCRSPMLRSRNGLRARSQ